MTRGQNELPIRVAVIGCGGRGSGAVGNAKKVSGVEVVALADLFPERISPFKRNHPNIAEKNCFSGFDAYEKALSVPGVNYVIIASPPGFHPIHTMAAVKAGKHVFVEKPAGTDGPGMRMALEAATLADNRRLCIASGNQKRFALSYIETVKRIQNGAIGSILSMEANWINSNALGSRRHNPNLSDMENQMRNWYHHVWLGGDYIVEQNYHNIDVCNWAMGEHPIKASGTGDYKTPRNPEDGDIYSFVTATFTYKNGVEMKASSGNGAVRGIKSQVVENFIGSKGTATAGTITSADGTKWQHPTPEASPYEKTHAELIKAIRTDRPFNNLRDMVDSTITCIMGREAAYTGQEITYDMVLNSEMKRVPEKFHFGKMTTPEVAIPGKYRFY